MRYSYERDCYSSVGALNASTRFHPGQFIKNDEERYELFGDRKALPAKKTLNTEQRDQSSKCACLLNGKAPHSDDATKVCAHGGSEQTSSDSEFTELSDIP